MSEELKTDAIEMCINQCENDYPVIDFAGAREQLTARVNELECAYAEDMDEAIKKWRKIESKHLQRIATLEKQIQQAERRGYELAMEVCKNNIGGTRLDIYNIPYEQAIAERSKDK